MAADTVPAIDWAAPFDALSVGASFSTQVGPDTEAFTSCAAEAPL